MRHVTFIAALLAFGCVAFVLGLELAAYQETSDMVQAPGVYDNE